MAFYKKIRTYDDTEDIFEGSKRLKSIHYPNKKKRIAENLLTLRHDLRQKISAKNSGNLIVGSWNIQNFDNGIQRLDESNHYIAEIIDCFDLCAVQEVRDNLDALERIMRLLGPNWDYFVSDVTVGDRGNSERMAFLYDTNRVFFRKRIGEIIPENNHVARNPFFAAFQSGWFRFTLCSTHVTFDSDLDKRRAEIKEISDILLRRAMDDREIYIFLGDMNIKSNDDPVFVSMRDEGWNVKEFGSTTTGASASKYDKMAFTEKANHVKYESHGSYDWRSSVFRPDEEDYFERVKMAMRGSGFGTHHMNNYNHFMGLEMSDHLPIWIELKTDYSERYLNEMIS
ncbi:MAG: endonuclease/exonuclease/phosphatase family protein [Pseudomonadota bacterium]